MKAKLVLQNPDAVKSVLKEMGKEKIKQVADLFVKRFNDEEQMVPVEMTMFEPAMVDKANEAGIYYNPETAEQTESHALYHLPEIVYAVVTDNGFEIHLPDNVSNSANFKSTIDRCLSNTKMMVGIEL